MKVNKWNYRSSIFTVITQHVLGKYGSFHLFGNILKLITKKNVKHSKKFLPCLNSNDLSIDFIPCDLFSTIAGWLVSWIISPVGVDLSKSYFPTELIGFLSLHPSWSQLIHFSRRALENDNRFSYPSGSPTCLTLLQGCGSVKDPVICWGNALF